MVASGIEVCAADEPEGPGEEALWQRLVDEGDGRARQKLLDQYDLLARQVAAGLFANRPDDTVEFADYLQYARVGLIEAVDRFRPGGEASFRTFATYRIRGSVLNGVTRENDRREQGAFRARVERERLESLGGGASRKQSEFEHLVEVSIGLALGYMLEDSGLVRDEAAVTEDNPYRASEYAELCSRVADALESLSTQEALVIRYHYFKDMEFEKIAELMGLSKGRISQVHKQALVRIRACLVGMGIDQSI